MSRHFTEKRYPLSEVPTGWYALVDDAGVLSEILPNTNEVVCSWPERSYQAAHNALARAVIAKIDGAMLVTAQ